MEEFSFLIFAVRVAVGLAKTGQIHFAIPPELMFALSWANGFHR
jgi:hypothetical protein